ncbi:hypothetical protein L3Q72_05335 [Vibrio sp. JC009]|uniref:hypothetical protein n=1 Tax=Vibrio sp. JC009 TaxID=2912314 RepID=UPI0023AF314B|nr:hypothetical protein [Vibrio sp. JC009]WED22816.1 hypothetical protein L3Q72_05335 [Vibrio sp. JC009]
MIVSEQEKDILKLIRDVFVKDPMTCISSVVLFLLFHVLSVRWVRFAEEYVSGYGSNVFSKTMVVLPFLFCSSLFVVLMLAYLGYGKKGNIAKLVFNAVCRSFRALPARFYFVGLVCILIPRLSSSDVGSVLDDIDLGFVSVAVVLVSFLLYLLIIMSLICTIIDETVYEIRWQGVNLHSDMNGSFRPLFFKAATVLEVSFFIIPNSVFFAVVQVTTVLLCIGCFLYLTGHKPLVKEPKSSAAFSVSI